MNNTKKLISGLIAGTMLVAAAPVFADSFRDRGYDSYHQRFYDRGHDRHGYRGHDRYYDVHRPVVVVQRPYVVQRPFIVEQPMYYSQPAPNYGIGAIIGQAIGTIYDNRQ